MTRTHDLIERLAAEGAMPPAARLGPRLWAAAALGLAIAAVFSAWGLRLRVDLAEALTAAPLLAKLSAMGALGWAAASAMNRLARPGARLSELRMLVPAGLAGLALAALAGVSSPETAAAADPLECAATIICMAAPALGALFFALRAGAPENPAAAGAAAGALAGALGAIGFALHCPIDHGPTVALWYGGAIAVTAALGALIGGRALRW